MKFATRLSEIFSIRCAHENQATTNFEAKLQKNLLAKPASNASKLAVQIQVQKVNFCFLVLFSLLTPVPEAEAFEFIQHLHFFLSQFHPLDLKGIESSS